MPVVVIGVNHRTAPLELLERLSFDADARTKALHALLGTENVSEAVVLSTCNRTEVYAAVEKFHAGFADVRDVIGTVSHLHPGDFGDHLYVHHDTSAVEHLFNVVAGLDSAVLGEHEIQGQVKLAWEAAQAEGTSGTSLNLVFRHALGAGKRARTETEIGRGTASVSYAAVALAAEHLGGLAGRRAVVMGAGDMASSMAQSLTDGGTADLVIANRTFDAAKALAKSVDGRAVRLAQLGDELAATDVLLTSTGAPSFLVTAAEIESAVAARSGRPLVIVDIAVPRDIDPAVGTLPGVTLLDMDDLSAFAAAGLAERAREVEVVRAILADEIERFLAANSAREAAPAIVALRADADAIREAELQRFAAKLETLDDDERAAVEALTQGIVAKLLHQPMRSLRDAAGTAKGDRLIQALRDLYDLDS